MSLAEAGALRQELKSQLAKGIDPAKAKRSAERTAKAASANTFAVIAAEYMAELVKKERAHRAPVSHPMTSVVVKKSSRNNRLGCFGRPTAAAKVQLNIARA